MAASDTDDSEPVRTGSTDDEEESPAIEEDLIEEEIRIDGICGVY